MQPNIKLQGTTFSREDGIHEEWWGTRPKPTLTAHLCKIEPPATNKSQSIQEPAAELPTKDP